MLIGKKPQGRPAIKDVWDDRVEKLLALHAKPVDVRRYRQKCEGYTHGQIGTRELISYDTVKGSLARCRKIIRTGESIQPAVPVRKQIKPVYDECELCHRGNGIVWTEEHERVCGRCYFILCRVRREVECRNAAKEETGGKDTFLQLLEKT